MLPTLADFGIFTPVYFRKIDNKGHWNLENEGLEDRINKIVDRVFKNDINSLWLINSNEDFYGAITSVSANRNPRDQQIDFIYINPEEIDRLEIKIEQTIEGRCLSVEHLHYNATMTREQAKELCHQLINKKQEAQRCKKQMTKAILEFQNTKGCKALDNQKQKCNCEN